MNFQKNTTHTPRVVAWPGTNTLHATRINFIGLHNELFSSTYQGEWGWFKLATHATSAVQSRKELQLIFEVDGHAAKYALFTEGHMNPFLPLNLSRFDLPKKLG
jgi:type VI protein secretion system component VasK